MLGPEKNPEFHAGSREESGSVDIRRKGDWRSMSGSVMKDFMKFQILEVCILEVFKECIIRIAL